MKVEMSLEFMANLLGKKAPELEATLKAEDGELKAQGEIESYFKSEFSNRLKEAKTSGKKEGKGWGQRETREEVEKELSQLLKVDSAPLEDMVQAYTGKVLESSKKALTPEDIRASDVFKEALKKERTKVQELSQEFEQFKSQISTKQKRTAVRSKLKNILKSNNFRLPQDETILDTRVDLLIDRMFEQHDFQVNEQGNVLVMDKEGNPVQDEMFNNVPFTEWSKKKATLVFDVAEGDNRISPGNKTQVPGQPGPANYSFPKIENTEQFFSEMDKMDDLEQKEAFQKHFEDLVERGQIQ